MAVRIAASLRHALAGVGQMERRRTSRSDADPDQDESESEQRHDSPLRGGTVVVVGTVVVGGTAVVVGGSATSMIGRRGARTGSVSTQPWLMSARPFV
jgi:hypothetical protein